MVLEGNSQIEQMKLLQTEEVRGLAGKIFGDSVRYLAYNAVAGLGIVGSFAYSFGEVDNYLNSGKEIDLFNLACSGICIGLAAVANQGFKVTSERLKVNQAKLEVELKKISDAKEYEVLQLPKRDFRRCRHRQSQGSITYCGDRDVKCHHKSDSDCCRNHPTAGWTRDYLCEPNKIHD